MIKNTTTQFTKTNLVKSGMYLLFGNDRQFIARFKHKGPVTMAQFKKELIKNHTPEDYFQAMIGDRQAPLEILKEKNPSWYEGLKSKWMSFYKY